VTAREPAGLNARWAPSAAQIVILSFLAFVLVGGLLLWLPICHVGAKPHAFIDDLFTSTSAVCVTGLTTIDVGTSYSPVGLLVLMGLIQVGGLGYMTMFSLGLLLAGKRLSLRDRLKLQEATEQPGLAGLASHVRGIVRLMLVAEATGMLLLATQTVPEFGWGKGLFYAAFFAVCAPNNAGFSMFPDGLARWQGNPVFLLTICGLIVFGGLGYNVVRELLNRHLHRCPPQVRWTPLIRIVLTSTVVLLATTTIALWGLEHSNARTLGPMAPGVQWLNAFFMAVQPRTSGFNSINTGEMTVPSLLIMIPLMFIGTGPGGTGGGIKLTTFVVLLAIVRAAVRGEDDVVMPFLRRRVEPEVARKAVAAVVLSVALVGTATWAIAVVEPLPMLPILFEVTSAFGTAGLTMGITGQLHDPSKLILIAVLLAGRVGTLTIALALFPTTHRSLVRYAEEPLLVG
jgi:trk system potassium uptake protein TrkH